MIVPFSERRRAFVRRVIRAKEAGIAIAWAGRRTGLNLE
jgi:hypothetical protein